MLCFNRKKVHLVDSHQGILRQEQIVKEDKFLYSGYSISPSWFETYLVGKWESNFDLRYFFFSDVKSVSKPSIWSPINLRWKWWLRKYGGFAPSWNHKTCQNNCCVIRTQVFCLRLAAKWQKNAFFLQSFFLVTLSLQIRLLRGSVCFLRADTS